MTQDPEPSPDDSAWLLLLQDDQAQRLSQTLIADPQKARTPVLVDQAWGQAWWMPLHVAAHAGASDNTQLLLDLGVQPNCRTRYRTPFHAQQTPLHLAAARAHLKVTQQLLEAGADPHVLDAHRQSPLHLAASAIARSGKKPGGKPGANAGANPGASDVIKALIEAGAPVDQADANARTALHVAVMAAAESGDRGGGGGGGVKQCAEACAEALACIKACIKALIEAGADPDALAPKDRDAPTPRLRAQALTDETLRASVLALMK